MHASHFEYIETAFLQLAFAIKLDTFLEKYPIDKEQFDTDLQIIDPQNQISLPRNQFRNYDELRNAAANNIGICFGVAAKTLWEAIREHSILEPRELQPQAKPEHQVPALVYMIRCCFAHGTAFPKWEIHNAKYRTQYQVGNRMIDLTHIPNGQVFSYSAIGGYETLWILRDEILRRWSSE